MAEPESPFSSGLTHERVDVLLEDGQFKEAVKRAFNSYNSHVVEGLPAPVGDRQCATLFAELREAKQEILGHLNVIALQRLQIDELRQSLRLVAQGLPPLGQHRSL